MNPANIVVPEGKVLVFNMGADSTYQYCASETGMKASEDWGYCNSGCKLHYSQYSYITPGNYKFLNEGEFVVCSGTTINDSWGTTSYGSYRFKIVNRGGKGVIEDCP